jgi:hypothetical protein
LAAILALPRIAFVGIFNEEKSEFVVCASGTNEVRVAALHCEECEHCAEYIVIRGENGPPPKFSFFFFFFFFFFLLCPLRVWGGWRSPRARTMGEMFTKKFIEFAQKQHRIADKGWEVAVAALHLLLQLLLNFEEWKPIIDVSFFLSSFFPLSPLRADRFGEKNES